MAGIFQNGLWTLGFDFITSIGAGGLITSSQGTIAVNAASARFSGNGLLCTANAATNGSFVGRTLGTNLPSMIIGVAFKTTGLSPSQLIPIITFWDTVAGAPNCTLAYNTQGQVAFYSTNGLGTSTLPSGLIGNLSVANVIVPNSYMCIECLVTIGSSGFLQCNINGQTVYSFTGNTLKSNPWTNKVFIGENGDGINHSLDDWYMLDLTGSAPFNSFLGKWRIQTDGPNSDSATAGLNTWAFTTPQGTDWGNCANIPLNAARFNSSATVGARMSFTFPTITTSRVLGLNTWMSLKEDSAGSRSVAPIFRSNAVDQTGATIVLPGSDTFFNQNSVIDPNTGQPWSSGSVAQAQACEIGLIVNA